MRGRGATLVVLATLDAEGRPLWHGIRVDATGARAVGPPPPSSILAETAHFDPATSALLDLLQASARSCLERLEELGLRLDELEGRAELPSVVELARVQRAVGGVRQHVERLSVVAADLGGPLGAAFAGLSAPLATVEREVDHLEGLSASLAQGARDLVAIRNAFEANRLAEAANALGATSNRIAALANTSNLRMLGVAYLALVLALASVVVLFPNAAATILGMPSAAWVPGVWVDIVLVVLAVVPLALVLSRPWIRRMLAGLGSYESRSAEGLSDLPEVSGDGDAAAESLLRRSR